MSLPDLQNVSFIENLRSRDPQGSESLADEWHEWFLKTEGGLAGEGAEHRPRGPSFKSRSLFHPAAPTPSRPNGYAFESSPREDGIRDRLYQLIRNFRVRGHMMAQLDPLGGTRPCPPELELEYYGFTGSDLDIVTSCATLPYDSPLTIRQIVERLKETYCRSIGVQFMHIDDHSVRRWLQQRMEGSSNRPELKRVTQLRILTRLTDAVIFEEFLRKKFLGAKTFSLEGSETLLPLLDLVVEKAGGQGVRDIVIGMAHRGRLNVLAHILGKDPAEIFREFADRHPEESAVRGDVKYHLGYSGDWTTAAGDGVHLSLCFNPSHLEFVNPVVLGRVRARQDRLGDRDRRQVLGVVIHGDAAFAGEGVVQETLNFSQLPGYTVGGALHLIINNQIGFTTGPDEARSTPYATDVARMLRAPIFHVNGEDPEAVAQVVELAMDFRREFRSDVFIDMYGYRRWGHNETDEPSFTQPVLYRAIARHPSVRTGYLEHLLKLGEIQAAEAEDLARSRREHLEAKFACSRDDGCRLQAEPKTVWIGWSGGPEPNEEPPTAVGREELQRLLRRLAEVPATFRVHPKLERWLKARQEMAEAQRPIDWSAAEALALGSLIVEGVPVRLTGQDTARGTFSQRHAVLRDWDDGFPHTPLEHVGGEPADVEIHNSPLSETGALGFEYGYSLDRPASLVLWEAQFGDFVNAAQVILDQFLASAEEKWERLSGLVLLLPHGFEGMGPEHSSARLERFLSLAANDNIQVAQPTTPAQYFHLLRRQALWRWRKPLVVLTPKSLLRHPEVVSPLEEFSNGGFQRVLPGDAIVPNHRRTTRRLLLCTGKIYYDLIAARKEQNHQDTAIVRVEQLYPLRPEVLARALEGYAQNTPALWVQEEPVNMGAWPHLLRQFGRRLLGRFPLDVVSRPESASPSTGSASSHKAEQDQIVAGAFGPWPMKNSPDTSACRTTRPGAPRERRGRKNSHPRH